MTDLSKTRVLMIATNGFAELFEPRQALLDAGADVTLASIDRAPIEGLAGENVAGLSRTAITPDLSIHDVKTSEFDALVLPGGVSNPDKLRMDVTAVGIVRTFVEEGKLVAAICHAPWLLIEADVVEGRRVTGWRSIRTDLSNAGAEVVDEEVVVDGNIITSRMPDDIAAFSRAVIQALAKAGKGSAE